MKTLLARNSNKNWEELFTEMQEERNCRNPDTSSRSKTAQGHSGRNSMLGDKHKGCHGEQGEPILFPIDPQ